MEDKKVKTGLFMDNVQAGSAERSLEQAARYKAMHTTLVRDRVKVYRNDPCPCGSGKKYKNCCLASGRYAPKLVDVKSL